MLVEITNMRGEEFRQRLDYVKDAYFPEGRYRQNARLLSDELKIRGEDKIIEKTTDELEKITKRIDQDGKSGLYVNKEQGGMPFPFTDRFHRYFLTRKVEKPFRRPRKRINDRNVSG